ncbi:distal tail protein Dit [Eubacterium limosum]|uniref:distal tail protein Dit n=1 Tax=Eubacterium limosum TaxID=1736 RepID=UPI001063767E|nr:distal tail protein Dit [Eubacterium limosum]
MSKFYIIFNNRSSEEMGVKFYDKLITPVRKMRYTETEIPGRDSKLYEENGYDDTTIEFSAEVAGEQGKKESRQKYRRIIKWLNNVNNNELTLSDDLGFFYIVNKVVLENIEQEYGDGGEFKVTFVCEPYQYLKAGAYPIPLPAAIFNEHEPTCPVYKMTGEGFVKLTVNGKLVTVNVGQNLTIDTKLGLCYREDGTLNNTALTGDYADLLLKEGENIFSYTASGSGVSIELIPNWRA